MKNYHEIVNGFRCYGCGCVVDGLSMGCMRLCKDCYDKSKEYNRRNIEEKRKRIKIRIRYRGSEKPSFFSKENDKNK